jgi:tetratricopeptide (TPR) repeat protein
MGDERVARADELYERAVFGGEPDGLAEADRCLDAVEADLALARGRLLHARFLGDHTANPAELTLFTRAADLYRALGDTRGTAEALFWVAMWHQVVRGDHVAAEPLLTEANELARGAGDRLTESYVVRHLALVEQAAGRAAQARELMARSTTLRREVGFRPGVAANLVGLAYLAAEAGDRDAAAAHLAEAESLARDSGAAGVLGWVGEARSQLSVPL